MILYWILLLCQVLPLVEVYNSKGKIVDGNKTTKEGRLSYWFKSEVSEPSRGFNQFRSEMKKGDTVHGQYEYSDGHVRVRVVYTADQDGYRVIKQERIPMKRLNTSSLQPVVS